MDGNGFTKRFSLFLVTTLATDNDKPEQLAGTARDYLTYQILDLFRELVHTTIKRDQYCILSYLGGLNIHPQKLWAIVSIISHHFKMKNIGLNISYSCLHTCIPYYELSVTCAERSNLSHLYGIGCQFKLLVFYSWLAATPRT